MKNHNCSLEELINHLNDIYDEQFYYDGKNLSPKDAFAVFEVY